MRKLNQPRRAMLAGLRSAPMADFETLIPPLPAWTGPRLEELSDDRAESVAASGVRIIGDPGLLRYTADTGAAIELGTPPTVLPITAAAGAVEHALAGMLKRGGPRRSAAPPPEPTREPTPELLQQVSSGGLLREVARRQVDRLRRKGR
jgi:hypothetical protein